MRLDGCACGDGGLTTRGSVRRAGRVRLREDWRSSRCGTILIRHRLAAMTRLV